MIDNFRSFGANFLTFSPRGGTYLYMARKLRSTSQVAELLRMQRPHLQRAIAEGKIKPPPVTRVGGIRIRLWSPRDIERARKALGRPKRRGTQRKARE
jgi:hypothetical protein